MGKSRSYQEKKEPVDDSLLIALEMRMKTAKMAFNDQLAIEEYRWPLRPE